MAGEPIGRVFRERATFVKNRAANYAEVAARYADEWVAFSADGAQVLAHDKDLGIVFKAVEAQGVGPEDYTTEWIPPPGEDYFL